MACADNSARRIIAIALATLAQCYNFLRGAAAADEENSEEGRTDDESDASGKTESSSPY